MMAKLVLLETCTKRQYSRLEVVARAKAQFGFLESQGLDEATERWQVKGALEILRDQCDGSIRREDRAIAVKIAKFLVRHDLL